MNKHLFFALSLTMAFAFSLVVSAQVVKKRPVTRFQTVTLPCQVSKGGDVQSKVAVTNDSGAAITAGTKIYVQIPAGSGATLPNLLESNFPNFATKTLSGPADHGGGCKASFTKVVTD